MKHVWGRCFLSLSIVAFLSTTLLAGTPSKAGAVRVREHVRNGSVIPEHYRSAPNGIPEDNYSYKGNVNPFTGEIGTRLPPAPGRVDYFPSIAVPPPQPVVPRDPERERLVTIRAESEARKRAKDEITRKKELDAASQPVRQQIEIRQPLATVEARIEPSTSQSGSRRYSAQGTSDSRAGGGIDLTGIASLPMHPLAWVVAGFITFCLFLKGSHANDSQVELEAENCGSQLSLGSENSPSNDSADRELAVDSQARAETVVHLAREVLGAAILVGLVSYSYIGRHLIASSLGLVNPESASHSLNIDHAKMIPHSAIERPKTEVIPAPLAPLVETSKPAEREAPSPILPTAAGIGVPPAKQLNATLPIQVPITRRESGNPVRDAQASLTYDRHSSKEYKAGIKLLFARNYREAAPQFAKAFEKMPDDAVCAYCLAAAYHGLGQMEMARQSAQSGIAVELRNPIVNWGQTMQFVQGWPRVWLDDVRRNGLRDVPSQVQVVKRGR